MTFFSIWNPPLSKAFLGNPRDVHDVCVIFQSKKVGLFPFLILWPCPICCLWLSQVCCILTFPRNLHSFSFGLFQILFSAKRPTSKSAFSLSHLQTTPPSRKRASSLKIQCAYTHVCRVIKLLTIEFRDAAGSSKDERMTMLAFSESGSNSTQYSAMKMWLILRNLVIFLTPSLEKK